MCPISCQAFYPEQTSPDKLKKTWRESENFCISFGGHLASVRSQLEQDTVWSLVQIESSNHPDYEFWLGLNERPNFGAGSLRPVWKWADGSAFSTVPFFHPTVDHSSDGILDYDCAAMDVQRGHWIKQSCHLAAGWVCEVQKGLFADGFDHTTNALATPAPTNYNVQTNGKLITEHYRAIPPREFSKNRNCLSPRRSGCSRASHV